MSEKYEQMTFADLTDVGQPVYCCLDFETGSLNAEIGGLASVAVVRLDENLNEVDRHYTLLYEEGRAYEQSAFDVNGLNIDQLKKEGWRPVQFIPWLHLLIDGLVVVNHNSQFDIRFLNNRGWNIQESVCTMENDYEIAKYSKHKLSVVYNRIFGHDFIGAHNSLDDTLATAEIFKWQVAKDPKYGQPAPINWTRFKH